MSKYKSNLDYLSVDTDISVKELEEIIEEADTITQSFDTHTNLAKTIEAYLKKGQCLQKLGEYEKSKESIKKALLLKPNMPEALVRLGIIYHEAKEYDAAIKYYDNAIRIMPDYPCALNNRAFSYNNMGEYDLAIKDYSNAIRIMPDYCIAIDNRGLSYANKNEYDKAIEDFSKVIRIKPDFFPAYKNLGSTYDEKKDYEKAIEYFSKAIEIKPKYSDLYLSRHYIYKRIGEKEKAMADESECIMLKKHADNYSLRSRHNLEKKQWEKALNDQTEDITRNPKDAHQYYLRSIIYEIRGEYELSFTDVLGYYEYSENKKEAIINIRAQIDSILQFSGIDILWKFTKYQDILIKVQNVFVSLVGSFMKNGWTKDHYKQLIREFYLFWKSYRVTDKIPVYKYTNISTLEKIYMNPCLYLRPALYQNDPDEGKVLFNYLSSNTHKDHDYIKKTIDEIKDKISDKIIAFTSCFSTDGDNLSMWNSSYSENGEGVSIGVLTNPEEVSDGIAIIEISKEESLGEKDKVEKKEKINITKLGLYKICYEKEKLKEISKSLANIEKHDYENDEFKKLLTKLFAIIAHLVKERYYQHENEIRYIYTTTIENSKKYIKIQENPFKDGIFIETEDVLFGVKKLNKKADENEEDVYEIKFGPKVDNNTFQKYKHVFEEKFNIPNKPIVISKSNINFR
ncbi:hypothetical protein AGMMS49940_17300 [Spirochaetia bacterium]|nr:hypothetical protein AGMMS49940_17300 [Spirochaetia bacterium]